MSTWNLGIDDVSEETRAFRDKISSKDGHIAAQQDNLVKQAAEINELKERLNEALHKLTDETRRALQLDADLQQRSEDLRNEKIASENVKTALVSAQEKNKSTTLEMRQLESTLERISYTSDEHSTRCSKLEREKSMLEARARELECNLREVTQPNPTTTPGRRTIARPRSSSLSNFRITTLEQDLLEVRGLLAKKEIDLQSVSQKLAHVQRDVIQADNQKSAMERKWTLQVEALQASLEDKEEELVYLREQQGDDSREEELLKRIEEDDAKIVALETMLRGEESSKELKDRLQRIESQLQEEQRRRAEGEEYQVELVRAKEEALDDLEEARQESRRLERELQSRNELEHAFKEKATKSLEACDDPFMNDDSCLIDINTMEPDSMLPHPPSMPQPETNIDLDTVAHVERLLAAIDRLRGERDNLRRDVQFLESESRFAIEALEAKLSESRSQSNTQTMITVDQLRAEMDEMSAELMVLRERNVTGLKARDHAISRYGLQVQGLAIALTHTDSYAQSLQHSLVNTPSTPLHIESHEELLQQNQAHIKVLEEQYNEMAYHLEEVTNQRNDLLNKVQSSDGSWDKDAEPDRLTAQEAHERLEEALREMAELNNQLEDLESERDSLTLQVTNLTTDMQIAQDELTNAESRYTNLQFHQLSSMTSSEATRTLRDHIEELEGRVMRRNELVGLLQHDVRRLDTNLRLQEERMCEMTSELEMLAAQKDAMVEDCADAREARNEALGRVEVLEEELENLESRYGEDQTVITSLIAVVAQTVSGARVAIRQARDQATSARNSSSAFQQEQSVIQHQLDEKIASLLELTKQTEEYQDELQRVRLAFSQSQTEARELSVLAHNLQEEKAQLESGLVALQGKGQETLISDLQAKNTELECRLQEVVHVGTINEDSERDLVQLKLQHAEALGALQGRLLETESSLEELRTRYNASDDLYKRAQEKAKKSETDLQQQLESTMNSLSELEKDCDQFESREKDHVTTVSDLQDELTKVNRDYKEALESCKALRDENAQLHVDLDRLQQDNDALLNADDDRHFIQQELERKVQSLQGRFEEETRLLEISKEEVARLDNRIQEEVDGRVREQQAHALALSTADERYERVQENISKLEGELAEQQKGLAETQEYLAASEEEKVILQQEITTLEAETQKSKSLRRYLEAQLKDSENLVASLREDIERLKSELAHSEKAWKAAEVNLSLQNAQHKRETAELQRELTSYRTRPNLDQALAELEERNNEMEELLRAKCAEIEENDDRVLEMLKEKKKLTGKVETLNRKVQNMQAKLTAAKASGTPAPGPQITSPPSMLSSSGSLVSQTPQSTVSAFSRPRPATASAAPSARSSFTDPPREITRKPSSRIVSGPSSLPRSKTPERSRGTVPMPVFKSRTPERHVTPEAETLQPAVVIGKKRAAPDDFEACENIPVQAFNADGEDVENKTPRVRRVLNSLQSGFTPVRHQSHRPTASVPSPRRNTGPPRLSPQQISDMTNSPYQNLPTSLANPSNKRSWLGKIRGSSQSTDKPSNTRLLFDRGESS